ncbi:ribonuclease R [Aphanizomenon flos-aquae NRERC-008]|uniref:VacB/RNase II family 3'-5' exoribonuclease n=1 Tax=Aphanizomenon flos-aquae FACHB-1249 TaxID=2692889 RepID=A0ABR8IT61_APHFL|nr:MULTISPECIES: ribonuclease R family protein [Aphanizomenon]MBD2391796.1 VacB/RNase II family 3'-5' exoribonuclease [Aphanizomenon flos-aquae FACHB-1171]MBD2558491.1 VacB/RNase II family 3'-5' exoribonuclease [Aphanizomenon flos-aquae FACHB-1290]MBD2632704.1 VacB/RNase II family 3'-5' exoribonuclease [Aphanizomenon sp. FACHB-1399]MBD2643523.1 VacB/RNase II family 3'-5' exoribonuclease [Aphanizomenon sp. FACHB-1401]MBD2658442.1 VacB/RNase II family 3'-5' exoribonuclease [Aphanizomenon flos-aq
MEFSIATLLANFTDDKLVARKVLEKKLGCENEESLEKLQITLDVLEKIGLLVKERGKYRRVTEEGLIEAKLRCSSKGFCFAIQDSEGSEDIYIRESHLSNAWNGDRVLVRVLKEGSRRRSPEGEVKLIMERSNHTLLARIKQVEEGFRAVPLDDRLLFELKLQLNSMNLEEAIDHLAHVEILRYPLAQYPPLGRVVQILGSDAEAAADIDLVTCKHDLSRTFPDAILDVATKLPKRLLKADLKNRLDLRDIFTFTIKSVNSDESVVENAWSLEKTTADNWRLIVHITDVSHYIQPDEALDREALKRGKSVYLGESLLPMLPAAVTERCSLIPGSDRLALSFIITINPQSGEVEEWEIQPSVISVDTSVSQTNAVSILTGKTTKVTAEVQEKLLDLQTLAMAIKQVRLERGSLQLNLPPTHNPYHDEGSMGSVVLNDLPPASLITELVILVNQLMANHLNALDIPCLWRVQGTPDPEDVQEMLKLAVNLGVELGLDPELEIQPLDYQHLTGAFTESPSEQVLTYLLQDTLKPSVYSVTKSSHFGLALSQYVHITAPLRRYPDILLQRVYHNLIEHGRDRRNTRVKERINLRHSNCHEEINWNVLPPELQQEIQSDLTRVVVQINDREKEVQEAEADLAGLQKASLMKQRIGEIFPGVITGVQSYGFFVEIEVPVEAPIRGNLANTLRVEGLVHVSSLKDDWYEYRARQQALFGRKNRASYRLGDSCMVQVKSVDYYRQQIDLVTVGADGLPKSTGANINNEDLGDIYSPNETDSFDQEP